MSMVFRVMNGIAPITCAVTATTSGWISVIKRSQPLAYLAVSELGWPSPV
jgi:hypothetical protein